MMSRTKIFAILVMSLMALATTAQAADCTAGLAAIQGSGAANEFKTCAAAVGAAKIPPECCAKLASFAQYASCLSDPKYTDQINSFLLPVTLSKASADCLGSSSG